MDNPYLDEFSAVSAGRKSWYETLEDHRKRNELRKKYSWAVPNERAISTLVSLGPLVEMGAGAGYWAKLIREMGGDIIPYDAYPPSLKNNEYTSGTHQWVDILEGVPEDVAKHSNRTLILCWPPYMESMAFDTLSCFKGRLVVYIGEQYMGCTGDAKFHDKLHSEFEDVMRVQIPRWPGIHDELVVYERKPAALDEAAPIAA